MKMPVTEVSLANKVLSEEAQKLIDLDKEKPRFESYRYAEIISFDGDQVNLLVYPGKRPAKLFVAEHEKRALLRDNEKIEAGYFIPATCLQYVQGEDLIVETPILSRVALIEPIAVSQSSTILAFMLNMDNMAGVTPKPPTLSTYNLSNLSSTAGAKPIGETLEQLKDKSNLHSALFQEATEIQDTYNSYNHQYCEFKKLAEFADNLSDMEDYDKMTDVLHTKLINLQKIYDEKSKHYDELTSNIALIECVFFSREKVAEKADTDEFHLSHDLSSVQLSQQDSASPTMPAPANPHNSNSSAASSTQAFFTPANKSPSSITSLSFTPLFEKIKECICCFESLEERKDPDLLAMFKCITEIKINFEIAGLLKIKSLASSALAHSNTAQKPIVALKHQELLQILSDLSESTQGSALQKVSLIIETLKKAVWDEVSSTFRM